MAQTKKSTSKSSTNRSASRAKSSGASTRAASKRSSANGSKATSTKAARPRSQTRSKAQSQNGAGSVTDAAVEKTKAAGQAVADAGSKVKTPLIAAGTALAGVAAGVLIKDRLGRKQSKNPLKRIGSVSMPKTDFGKLDLDKVKSAAERVSAYGQQASDLAKAVEKTQKKNK